MRSYVHRLLAAQGFKVEACVDGESALAAARAAPPDLILSDVMMPKLDGFGLLAAVRADPVLKEPSLHPIVGARRRRSQGWKGSQRGPTIT